MAGERVEGVMEVAVVEEVPLTRQLPDRAQLFNWSLALCDTAF